MFCVTEVMKGGIFVVVVHMLVDGGHGSEAQLEVGLHGFGKFVHGDQRLHRLHVVFDPMVDFPKQHCISLKRFLESLVFLRFPPQKPDDPDGTCREGQKGGDDNRQKRAMASS